jgi:hypothetical protein
VFTARFFVIHVRSHCCLQHWKHSIHLIYEIELKGPESEMAKGTSDRSIPFVRNFPSSHPKEYSPSIGVVLLGIFGAFYFFGGLCSSKSLFSLRTYFLELTLGPKPYYWPIPTSCQVKIARHS